MLYVSDVQTLVYFGRGIVAVLLSTRAQVAVYRNFSEVSKSDAPYATTAPFRFE